MKNYKTILILVSLCLLVACEKKPKVQSPTPSLYTIKDFNGQIALFKNAESTPTEVYDIFLENLPKNDVDRLKNGIHKNSEDEILKVLEDYRD